MNAMYRPAIPYSNQEGGKEQNEQILYIQNPNGDQ